jgi:hypothetical protein
MEQLAQPTRQQPDVGGGKQRRQSATQPFMLPGVWNHHRLQRTGKVHWKLC